MNYTALADCCFNIICHLTLDSRLGEMSFLAITLLIVLRSRVNTRRLSHCPSPWILDRDLDCLCLYSECHQTDVEMNDVDEDRTDEWSETEDASSCMVSALLPPATQDRQTLNITGDHTVRRRMLEPLPGSASAPPPLSFRLLLVLRLSL